MDPNKLIIKRKNTTIELGHIDNEMEMEINISSLKKDHTVIIVLNHTEITEIIKHFKRIEKKLERYSNNF